MSEKTILAALVGESPEVIAKAESKRAGHWPLITAITDVPMTPIAGSRKVLLGKVDPELQRIKQRLASINSAAWWLRANDIQWSMINACRFGMPSGAVLPADFYAPERVAERAAQSQRDAGLAQFLDLPKLKGTDKQVAWAETIRGQFRRYCDDCMMGDAFLTVAKRQDAKHARFWIDHRHEIDFKDLLEDASKAG